MLAVAYGRLLISLALTSRRVMLRVVGSKASLLSLNISIAGILSACAMTPIPAMLSTDDQTAVSQLSAYLNGLQRFEANFTQVGPDGEAKGVVWLDRPGRLRVEYYLPAPRTILANHGRLLIVDHLTRSTTTLPVSNTPIDILLRASIPFSGPVTVTSLQRRPTRFDLALIKSLNPGQGTLTLQFSKDSLALVGVKIEDRLHQVTILSLSNFVRDPAFNAGWFDYQPAARQ